jgi:tRNA(adenine34) deaminase
MLHARLKRVVFGALDAKTGAAGSILNLFGNPQLNHQTQVQGGVLQEPCAQALQAFFREKRSHDAAAGSVYPLRQDALRTPDACFAGLADYPWQARYVQDLPALAGLRMHYLDEGSAAHAPTTLLCLHGPADWSYTYRRMLPVWIAAGHRVLAPDLIGFGKSDKPKRAHAHTPELHHRSLMQLIERLDLRNIVLVVQTPGAALGLALTENMPERFKRVLSISLNATTLQDPAYALPFPDAGHRAGLQAFSSNAWNTLPDSGPNVDVRDMGQLGDDGGLALAHAVLADCAAG